MGGTAAACRETGGRRGGLDEPAFRRDSESQALASTRSWQASSAGEVLSESSGQRAWPPSPSDQTTAAEVAPDDLWFGLSDSDRGAFGCHFSTMLVKAAKHLCGADRAARRTSHENDDHDG